MRRAFAFFRIPLLAALLAGPLAQRSPAVWSETGLRGSDSSALAASFALPAGRIQAVLHHRQPADRQGHRSGALLSLTQTPGIATAVVPAGSSQCHRDPTAEPARHFPLFPTGPPSLS